MTTGRAAQGPSIPSPHHRRASGLDGCRVVPRPHLLNSSASAYALVMSNYTLVIPSRERASWLSGRVTNTLKHVAHLSPILYVRADDSQLDEYSKLARTYDAELMIQDPSALGAAQTYDSLIEHCISNGTDRLVVLDDDLTFSVREHGDDGGPRYTKATPEQIAVLVEDFAMLTCEQMPGMSMTPIMKRSQPTLISFAKPLMWAYSFYTPHFEAHPEHRFWDGKHIEARCDLNLSLKLLTDGFLLAYLATIFIPDNVNNPGGCSTYRSIDLERQSVDHLQATYPDLVRTRKMKGWVEDPDLERDAPVIEWKKAFDVERFQERFGISPSNWASKKLSDYVDKYSAWADPEGRGLPPVDKPIPASLRSKRDVSKALRKR